MITSSVEATFQPGSGPLNNPLKGWAAYSEPGDSHCLPVSMAYFYNSWRSLEPAPGKFAFDSWEKLWDNPSARGKHVVLRIYLDYPSRPTGVPEWVIQRGVRLTPYTEEGGGMSPDYEDPRLLAPLLDFIQAFGKRYNRDPRVAFIALGTLGFWGEWHTYPRTALFASPRVQQRVLEAYRRAFPDKILVARYPGNSITGKSSWIGYHDDLFPEDTDGKEAWKFLPSLRRSGRANNWQKSAIGAEMVPHAATKYLGTDWETTITRAKQMHLSWIGPYCPANEPKLPPVLRERACSMVRQIGYEFLLKHAKWEISLKQTLSLHLEGMNQGIAPFYYPWSFQVALINQEGTVIFSQKADVDIRRWLPGLFLVKAHLQLPSSLKHDDGALRLAIGIIDPWTKKPSVRFANTLALVRGWTILGTVPKIS